MFKDWVTFCIPRKGPIFNVNRIFWYRYNTNEWQNNKLLYALKWAKYVEVTCSITGEIFRCKVLGPLSPKKTVLNYIPLWWGTLQARKRGGGGVTGDKSPGSGHRVRQMVRGPGNPVCGFDPWTVHPISMHTAENTSHLHQALASHRGQWRLKKTELCHRLLVAIWLDKTGSTIIK